MCGFAVYAIFAEPSAGKPVFMRFSKACGLEAAPVLGIGDTIE